MSISSQSSSFDPLQAQPQGHTATSATPAETVSWRSRESGLSHIPDGLPATIHQPKYAIGDRCRWIPMTTTDWGTIIGQVYAPVGGTESVFQWNWLYLVLLDSNSPSRQWVTTDWAEEGELEALSSLS